MDMRRANIELQRDGHTRCSVCADVLDSGTEVILVTLPCMHIFHQQCIVQWLESDNWECPLCRQVVPRDVSIILSGLQRIAPTTHLRVSLVGVLHKRLQPLGFVET
jgi:hypothetical protein